MSAEAAFWPAGLIETVSGASWGLAPAVEAVDGAEVEWEG